MTTWLRCEKQGGSPSLPDRIRSSRISSGKPNLRGRFKVFFICTFADDEPFLEVIGAGKLLKNTVIYISGNMKSHIGK
jgi:hypothetical protein